MLNENKIKNKELVAAILNDIKEGIPKSVLVKKYPFWIVNYHWMRLLNPLAYRQHKAKSMRLMRKYRLKLKNKK